VTCPDKEFQCPDGDTCCQLKDGGFGCCPMASAVCCKDGTHCCPHGSTCNLEKGTCDSVAANLLMSVLRSQGSIVKRKEFPATVVKSEPAKKESFENFVGIDSYNGKGHKCNATLTCPEEKTCCNGRGRKDIWGCCPWENGVCCPNMMNCCPEGTKCDDKRKKCFIPTEMDSLLEKASVKQQELVPGIQRKLIPAVTVKTNPEPELNWYDVELWTPCNINGSETAWGCCPFARATCCLDHATCCPGGEKCVTTTDGKAMCTDHRSAMMDSLLEKASKPQQNLVPSPKMKMVPATYVPENPLPSYLNCPAPTQTLCNSMGSTFLFGCCPLTNAVCCPDHATCCPSGMECAKEGAMCAGNRSFMVETFFRMLDSHTLIPRKWTQQQRKGDNREQVRKYQLLGDNSEW